MSLSLCSLLFQLLLQSSDQSVLLFCRTFLSLPWAGAALPIIFFLSILLVTFTFSQEWPYSFTAERWLTVNDSQGNNFLSTQNELSIDYNLDFLFSFKLWYMLRNVSNDSLEVNLSPNLYVIICILTEFEKICDISARWKSLLLDVTITVCIKIAIKLLFIILILSYLKENVRVKCIIKISLWPLWRNLILRFKKKSDQFWNLIFVP